MIGKEGAYAPLKGSIADVAFRKKGDEGVYKGLDLLKSTAWGVSVITAIQAGEINLNAAQLAQQGRTGELQGLIGTGGVQRNIAQAGLEAQRQTALQNIQEPYQRVAFVSDIQSGVPSGSQARISQTSAPQPSPLGQAVGTGIGAYAAFTGG